MSFAATITTGMTVGGGEHLASLFAYAPQFIRFVVPAGMFTVMPSG